MIEVDEIGGLLALTPLGDTPVALPGWHVNITRAGLAARPDLEPFVVTPATLRRVWAGDDPAAPQITVALRFMTEAEGRAALAA